MNKKWTKEELDNIWEAYVGNGDYMAEIDSQFRLDLGKWHFATEAPCSWCGEAMLKSAYGTTTSEQEEPCAWDVDYYNNDKEDDELPNLQPMHPWCIKEKENN
ncbi:hypothetical protein [Mesoplasma lactucae]|uniref:Uncharacterized protein n=1 Tax=Mesoplasma lactucae ATCC 49193 TaxID=81460 RepID=A0A291ISQ6_9MOLU|nr:hypothetical protein [Mesoplasma lactucae]ATG97736.1 hypothetical protein CP520_03300 [Mesoplasma lactucae ATCC 49193]ATZ20487.1 hypothetical protein MLACT_v1c06660 [Mesoplasma lactucae ATCC 49193]MCL8216658.1 hypothetical protein [Mesoplasma lactucae ATCC 49193]